MHILCKWWNLMLLMNDWADLTETPAWSRQHQGWAVWCGGGGDPLVLSHPTALPNPILNSLYNLKQLFANLSLFLYPLFRNRNKATLLPCSSSQPPLHPQLITFLFSGFLQEQSGDIVTS